MTIQKTSQVLEPPEATPGESLRFFSRWKWLILPVVAVLAYEASIGQGLPPTGDADVDLMNFQLGLSLLVVGFVLVTKTTATVGWTFPIGFGWIWVAGPVWLAVLTPIPTALQFLGDSPEKALTLFAVSVLVAVNEETLFRGFIFRGLLRHSRPMPAMLASSLAFGCLHLLNLNAGADPVFVAGQVVAATGTGAILAAVTLRSGSIVPAALLHFAADFFGLATLGGYTNAIGSADLAPMLIVSGLVAFAWGTFWVWKQQRSTTAVTGKPSAL